MSAVRAAWRWVSRWPAPVRHLVLVVGAAAGTAAWDALVGGAAPREVVMAALIAAGAVITPLIQSYGAGQRERLDAAELERWR